MTSFKFRDWVVTNNGEYTENRWQATHKDYDGAPVDSFGPPADNRFVWGESWLAVRKQILEIDE